MEGLAVVAVRMLLLVGMVATQTSKEVVANAKMLAPDLFKGTVELARSHGYRAEAHSIVTEDGYTLTVHRLLGSDGGRPVLMHHGLFGSSRGWLVAGPRVAPGYFLADSGYDVWLANARGNKYSRHHKTMSNKDPKYWRFSWHEMGVFDLPAVIDYVLHKTNQSSLYYVGHSMGNNIFYVMASMKPEYNRKIRLVVSLAPAPYVSKARSISFKIVMNVIRLHKAWFKRHRLLENISSREDVLASLYYLCHEKTPTQVLCIDLFTSLMGNDKGGLNKTNIPLYMASITSGTSTDTLDHFQQLYYADKFQRWDYGPEDNLRYYGQRDPPKYDLNRITAPVALHYSEGDLLVQTKAVERLSKELPNVVQLRKVPNNYFSHIGFLMHEQLRSLLGNSLLQTMATF